MRLYWHDAFGDSHIATAAGSQPRFRIALPQLKLSRRLFPASHLFAAKLPWAAQLAPSEKRHLASTTICRDISGSLWFHHRSIDTDSRPCVSKMVALRRDDTTAVVPSVFRVAGFLDKEFDGLSAGDLHALQGFDAVVERGVGAEEAREHSASLQRRNDAER